MPRIPDLLFPGKHCLLVPWNTWHSDDKNGNNTTEGTNTFVIHDIASERATAVRVVAKSANCKA
jgi:hypothetical protein